MKFKFTLFGSLIFTLSQCSASPPLHPTVNSTAIPLSPKGGDTYPRLVLVQGAILAAYESLEGNTHFLNISRSTNGGKTFSALGSVASGTGNLGNPDLILLPNGNIVCTYRNHDLDSSSNPTYYRITASLSTDGGKKWTFLSQVDQRPANSSLGGHNGLWVCHLISTLDLARSMPNHCFQEPFNRISASGKALQVYYASENSATDQDILMRSSTNDGATWSDATTVTGGTTTGRDGMPGCTSFPTTPSKVLCVFETTEGSAPLFTVKSVVSNNDGITWGERSMVYVPTGSGTNGSCNFPQTCFVPI